MDTFTAIGEQLIKVEGACVCVCGSAYAFINFILLNIFFVSVFLFSQ